MTRLGQLETALEPLHFSVRGLIDGSTLDEFDTDKTLVLIGNVGGAFWPLFAASDFSGENALDRWTKHVLNPIADGLAAEVFYPNDQPYQPFQQWSMKAEGLQQSPLGLLIHPTFGLWHAYRAAFLLHLDNVTVYERQTYHPCDDCHEKPCLHTCPVEAYSLEGLDAKKCATHVVSPKGFQCRENGCLARQACPIGREFSYSGAQQGFHMSAFSHSQNDL